MTLNKTQVLTETNVYLKLKGLDEALEKLILGGKIDVPDIPGRNVQILPLKDLPNKPGLSTKIGQARLVHDLASIELQAMELGLRTLSEFPEAPSEFRNQLCQITREEGMHLSLCLKTLDNLGYPWGSFPVHVMLWNAVSIHDELLDRIVIVHRYLEGSGLDASDTILKRLVGVNAKEARDTVEVIRRDEVAHVQFGSYWHHKLTLDLKVNDFAKDLLIRLKKVQARLPRRLEPIRREIRKNAGFLPEELDVLEKLKAQQI